MASVLLLNIRVASASELLHIYGLWPADQEANKKQRRVVCFGVRGKQGMSTA